MTNEILAGVDQALDSNSTGDVWVKEYSAPQASDAHQFVLFLKPEVTYPSRESLAGVLDLVTATLNEWQVETGAIRILRGDYLETYRIMDQHYGVLNAISKQGRSALAPGAEDNLKSLYADQLANGAQVLGGHEFLAQNPEFSPLALATLSDNLGGEKLGGGSYAISLTVKGQAYILLNAFHAYQLEPFCRPDGVIVLFECTSSRDWADLRQKLAGATNPEQAEKGSLRNQLLENQEALGLPDVSQGANGIHLSAGPLEGMVELQRFLSNHEAGEVLNWSDLAFGKRLSDSGLGSAQIETLATNPMLEFEGSTESAFDLTEEVNAKPSAERLAAASS